jgi:excisionase family DNA binding protein
MMADKRHEIEPVAHTRSEAIIVSRVPGHTLDDAIEKGELRATRSGRRLIILREDLLEWLRKCRDRGEIPPRLPTEADRARLAKLNRERAGKAKIA